MPRRKRNRKSRKNQNETPNNKKPTDNIEGDVNGETPLPPTISITNILTPLKATPSPKINNNNVQFHRAVPTTPVNHQRSYIRRGRIAEQATPNFSNINLLFNLENNNTPCNENRPIRVNVGTQTVYYQNNKNKRDVATQANDNDGEENQPITETPKINQISFDLNDEKLHSFDKTYKKNSVLFNVNPYVKNNEAAEISFFSTQFYNLKSASTPITHLPLKHYGYTPKSEVQALKNEILALRKRCYKSASPKINRLIHTKHCNKSHNISLLRQKSPTKNNISAVCRRISIDVGASNSDTAGDSIFSKVKKYGRYTAKWTMKLIELCWELGITIKKVFCFVLFFTMATLT